MFSMAKLSSLRSVSASLLKPYFLPHRLRDTLIGLDIKPTARHDAAADLLSMYAHTKDFFTHAVSGRANSKIVSGYFWPPHLLIVLLKHVKYEKSCCRGQASALFLHCRPIYASGRESAENVHLCQSLTFIAYEGNFRWGRKEENVRLCRKGFTLKASRVKAMRVESVKR